MNPHGPAWLDARIRAYGAALGAPGEDIEAALRAAAHAPTPAAALAVARALLVGVATPARADGAPPQRDDASGDEPSHARDHTPGGVSHPVSDAGHEAVTDHAWAGVLAGAQGVAGDPRRAWLAQDLAVLRTPVAAQPFRRRPLRRLVSGLLLRPLAGLLRPVQLLSGRVAD